MNELGALHRMFEMRRRPVSVYTLDIVVAEKPRQLEKSPVSDMAPGMERLVGSS